MSLHNYAIASALFVAGFSFGAVLMFIRDERPREAAWAAVLMMINLFCAALLSVP